MNHFLNNLVTFKIWMKKFWLVLFVLESLVEEGDMRKLKQEKGFDRSFFYDAYSEREENVIIDCLCAQPCTVLLLTLYILRTNCKGRGRGKEGAQLREILRRRLEKEGLLTSSNP